MTLRPLRPSPARCRTPRARGFTLIELMVAVTLLVTITTIIYGSFGQSFRVRQNSEDFHDRYRDVRQALHRMAKEISMAYLSTHHHPEDPRTATCFKGTQRSLTFTSFAHLRLQQDAEESDQATISYYLDTVESITGGRVSALMRRQDTTPSTTPLRGGTTDVLAENVAQVRFQYWDETREIAGEAWVDEWDACQDRNTVGDRFPNLPERVLIELEFLSHTGKQTEKLMVESRIMITEALQFQR